jgi:hypothetical protein
MKDDAKATKAHYRKLRRELSVMLGYGDDPDALPIDRSMRLDVVMNLKCALDERRGRLYRGEAIDSAEMLRLSEALDRYLPKHPEPAEVDPFEGIDPHKKLEELVTRFFAAKEATEAEDAADCRVKGLPDPVTDLEAAQARIAQLEDEIAHLRGTKPRALPAPDGEAMKPLNQPVVAKSGAETKAQMERVNNDRSLDHRVMGSQPRDEPWRGYTHLFE